jgi:hypothetical protein
VFFLNPEASVEIVLTKEEAARAAYFWVRLNNIDGPNRVAFRLNGGEYVPVNKSTVETDGLGEGQDKDGNFKFPNTRDVRYRLPAGSLREGANTIGFRYAGVINDAESIHQFSMGFRVLGLNFKDATGTPLVPPSAFQDDDPSAWSTSYPKEQVARGRQLWREAKLAPNPFSSTKIEATCNDCHVDLSDDTRDGGGYDLKYFNYSSHAIVSRAQFHGLNKAQGEDIAAYIRSLPTLASKHGRPWNPPYQPGPALGTRPASEWAAGAGVDGILTDESKLVPFLFPSGTVSDADISLATNRKLDLSTMPSFPLLDWNEWLPTVPMGAASS